MQRCFTPFVELPLKKNQILRQQQRLFTEHRGQLRKIVGQQLGVRFTPTLTYSIDTVPEASAHMEALLDRARKRDEELAKLREGAAPAGDADPYKTSSKSESEE